MPKAPNEPKVPKEANGFVFRRLVGRGEANGSNRRSHQPGNKERELSVTDRVPAKCRVATVVARAA